MGTHGVCAHASVFVLQCGSAWATMTVTVAATMTMTVAVTMAVTVTVPVWLSRAVLERFHIVLPAFYAMALKNSLPKIYYQSTTEENFLRDNHARPLSQSQTLVALLYVVLCCNF